MGRGTSCCNVCESLGTGHVLGLNNDWIGILGGYILIDCHSRLWSIGTMIPDMSHIVSAFR